MKFIFRIIILFIFFSITMASVVFANDMVGIGIHVGFQQNVGSLRGYSYDPTIEYDPQNNIFLGASFKFNIRFFMLRTGVDSSFLMNKGSRPDDSTNISTYNVQYTAIPVFIGMIFPILSRGEFYMGGGGAYITGTGTIKSAGSTEEEDLSVTAEAYGVMAGIQLETVSSIRIYLEWQYLNGRSKPLRKTRAAPYDINNPDWKDYYVDYTGHRILVGVMYYII